MLGAIVGSSLEWNSCEGEDIFLVNNQNSFTDDSILTLAVAKLLMVIKNILMKNKWAGYKYLSLREILAQQTF